jgi:tetratricopeptide (TPR) repeat protein
MIGTPEYMSPEQVEGKEVNARSDIYSLGIILYEMLTGRVPFEGDTPFTVGVKHKSETPKNPKLLNPSVPDELSGVILKCLEKEKAKRYQSATDLRAELERLEKGLPTTARIAPERKAFTSKEITVKFQPKKLIIPALVVVALIIAAVIFWPKKALNLDPKVVAVAVFENKTGDPKLDYIGSLAAERIMQGLAQVGQFTVAPMPRSEAIPPEAKSKDWLRTLAKITRAGKVVHGDYYLQGDTIQFHAWVEDMVAGKNILALEPASGPAQDPAAALEPLRLRLMGGVAGIFSPVLKDWLSLLKEPPKYEAYREYIEGSEAFYRSEFPKAVEHFLRAEERDPSLKVALIYACVALSNQGQYARADELAQEVAKSRAELSTGERFFLDIVQAWYRGDNEASLRSCRQIISDHKTWDWIYQNALEAVHSNCPQEAIDLLNGLDPFSEVYENWGYWWVLTMAHHMLGDYKKELKEARRGRRHSPELFERLYCEARSLAALGRMQDLQRLFEESKTLPPESGFSPGIIMLDMGRELRAQGFREDAVRALSQAIQWFEARPEQEKTSEENRYSQASAFYVLGKWKEAKMLFEGLHADILDNIDYLGYLGSVAVRMGNKEEALRISKELGGDKRPYLFGKPTYWRARIAAVLGDKEGAVNLLRQATKEGYNYDDLHPCEDFESLADYPPYIQLMKPKG